MVHRWVVDFNVIGWTWQNSHIVNRVDEFLAWVVLLMFRFWWFFSWLEAGPLCFVILDPWPDLLFFLLGFCWWLVGSAPYVSASLARLFTIFSRLLSLAPQSVSDAGHKGKSLTQHWWWPLTTGILNPTQVGLHPRDEHWIVSSWGFNVSKTFCNGYTIRYVHLILSLLSSQVRPPS